MANRLRVVESTCLLICAAATVLACAGADGNATANVGQTPYGAASAGPYGQPPGAGQMPGAPSAMPGYPAAPNMTPPGYGQQPQPAPGAAATPQSPLGQIVTTDPSQLQAMFAQAAQAAQAFLQPPGTTPAPAPGGTAAPAPGGMPGDIVDLGIKAAALIHAKGMQPEGNEAKGQLSEGGHLAFMVPMQAGKCYTLIGFSPPGQIRNVDLNLLAPPFYNFLAGQDASDDNLPVIGKAPNPMCPVVPLPLNYKVDIVARAGSGSVGVQLYSRPK